MKHTIVFADNERGIRRFCKQELETAGYRVLLAGDGEDVLDAVAAFAVDLVIVDEHMPRCSGMEAARRIRERLPALPVILYTADPDYEGCEGPLFDAVVIKSADITALKKAVVELVGSQREATAMTGASLP